MCSHRWPSGRKYSRLLSSELQSFRVLAKRVQIGFLARDISFRAVAGERLRERIYLPVLFVLFLEIRGSKILSLGHLCLLFDFLARQAICSYEGREIASRLALEGAEEGARPDGIEPSTAGLEDRRSIH